MKHVKQIIVSVALLLGVVGVLMPATASAVNVYQPCAGNTDSSVCKGTNEGADYVIKTVVNTLLFLLGVISVIMIIVSGIRYTTSSGDASAVTSAKNTLTYSIVGLIVAILAFAIVNYVIKLFT